MPLVEHCESCVLAAQSNFSLMHNIYLYFAKALKKPPTTGRQNQISQFSLPSASISMMTMSLSQFGGWFLDPKVDNKKGGGWVSRNLLFCSGERIPDSGSGSDERHSSWGLMVQGS